MYKLFSFLFFTSISIFIIFAPIDEEFPMDTFIVANIVLYLVFIFYVLLTSLFKAKYSLHKTKLIKLIKSKFTQPSPGLAFITSYITLIYVLLISTTIFFIFVVTIFPAFRTSISNIIANSKSKQTPTFDIKYFNAKFSELNEKISNLEFANFFLINDVSYKDSDSLYEYEFEVKGVKLISGKYFDLDYLFQVREKKAESTSQYHCLPNSQVRGKMNILGKIKSFDAASYLYPITRDLPVYVIKVSDEKTNHFRLNFPRHPLDIFTEYISVNPEEFDDISLFNGKINYIIADTSKSTMIINYSSPSPYKEKISNYVIEFYLDEDKNLEFRKISSEEEGSNLTD